MVREQDDINLKLSQITKKIENLELKNVSEGSCVLCVTHENSIDDCLTLPDLKEILNGGGTDQAEANAVSQRYDPFSNTYNPGTKDVVWLEG